MTAPLKLSMTCGAYDRTRALIDGTVRPEGIELDVCSDDDHLGRQQKIRDGGYVSSVVGQNISSGSNLRGVMPSWWQ